MTWGTSEQSRIIPPPTVRTLIQSHRQGPSCRVRSIHRLGASGRGVLPEAVTPSGTGPVQFLRVQLL